MTIEEIDVMLRSANPVRESDVHDDPDDASALLLTIKRRSGLVKTTDVKPRAESTHTHGVTSKRGVLVASVTFAVGLIVGAVALIAVTAGEDGGAPVATIAPPVAPVQTPEGAREVADAFVALYNEGDINGALAMLAPDATVNTFLSSDVGQLTAEMEWHAAQDSQWHLGECSASLWAPPGGDALADAIRLTCSGTFTQSIWVALGSGFQATHIIVVDSSDRITLYRQAIGTAGYGLVRSEADFREWVEEAHPGDELKIWHEADPLVTSPPPRTTIESATLRNLHADEYANYVRSLEGRADACQISERGWTSGCIDAL